MMVNRHKVTDDTGTVELCETYSTTHMCLLQEETGAVYSDSVVDVIAGYDQQGIPYPPYTYVETDIPVEPEEPEEPEESYDGS